MKTNVDREDLLAILTENRTKHRGLFEEALSNWQELVVEELGRFTQEIRSGKRMHIASALPVPEDHTDEYDKVIKMLELSVDDAVELDEHDVEEYVLDRWGWARSFAANTLRYTERR